MKRKGLKTIASHYGEYRTLKKKRDLRIRIYIFALGGISLLLSATIAFIKTPIPHVSGYTIRSSQSIDHANLLSTLKPAILSQSGILGSDNYFAWPEGEMPATANFSSIFIDKKLFKKEIVISATPRQKTLAWCLETQNEELTQNPTTCYWIDNLGVVIGSGPITAGQFLATIYEDARNHVLIPAQTALDQKTLTIITAIVAGLRSLNIPTDRLEYFHSSDELRAQTQSGTEIRFSTRFDPIASALPALSRIQEKPGLNNLEYIDLTAQNRVYYKQK